jgi:hypothetical protein
MNLTIGKFWQAADHMLDTVVGRLPALMVAVLIFVLFYGLSLLVSRFIRRATPQRRQNLAVVFARLIGGATILIGFLVAFSVVAPSFQAADLIKVLGIGGVAIGFAFQNILQNFLAGLLLLWAEPFRVGDEIKLDAFEGTVREIQTRHDYRNLRPPASGDPQCRFVYPFRDCEYRARHASLGIRHQRPKNRRAGRFKGSHHFHRARRSAGLVRSRARGAP